MYMAALNGCDAIVFTAGIGTYSAVIRQRVCADLDGLGIELDPERNNSASGHEARVSTDNSRVQVWVIPTNEELVIARDAMKLARATRRSSM
jgi:acetate kinase